MVSLRSPQVSEVLIIGSGPAGCAAAATCHAAGLSMMIVTDKDDQYPATDIISPLESIHPGVSTLLNKIGASGAETKATRGFYTGIYVAGNYNAIGEDQNGTWKGMHIDRKIFDADLLKRVKESGVSVIHNTKVEDFISDGTRITGVKTDTGELYARYIIDASGKKALAFRKLNFKRKFYSPAFICTTGISALQETFALDNNAAQFIPSRDGWTWLAPAPPYVAWTRLHMHGDKSLLPPDELMDAKLIGKIEVANMRWRLTRPVCREGIILCGDAAGILDPAAGQGIFNALVSGMVAANSVNLCLQQPALEAFHLAGYDDWFVRQFEEKVQNLKMHIEILN